MSRLLVASLALILSSAACVESDSMSNPVGPMDEENLGQRFQEIVGGIIDPGHPYTVAVNDKYCSGTLISSRTVISAAHCYSAGLASTGRIFFGQKSGGTTPSVKIKTARRHPNYVRYDQGDDLMIIELAEDAPVPPAPLFRGTMDNTPEFVGPNFTWVGFGRSSGSLSDYGTKRVVTFPIQSVGPAQVGGSVGSIDETMFYYATPGVNTCNGDSGGPAYFVKDGVEQHMGVTSFGDAPCRRDGVNSRTDGPQLAAFIQPAIEEFEGTNDCRADGVCSAACVKDGFNWDPDCASNHCAADGVCSTSCAMPVDPDCSSLGIDYCGADGFCDPSCATPDKDCEGLGEPEAPKFASLVCTASAAVNEAVSCTATVTVAPEADYSGITVTVAPWTITPAIPSQTVKAGATSVTFGFVVPASANAEAKITVTHADLGTVSTTVAFNEGPVAPVGTGLVINEVDYDGPGSDTDEFVEIYNPTSEAISLEGVALVLINGSNKQEYFATNRATRILLTESNAAVLPPGGYLVIGETGARNVIPEGTPFIQLDDNSLQNDREGVVLWNTATKAAIDSLSYEGVLRAVSLDGVTFDVTEGPDYLSYQLYDSSAATTSLARQPNGTDSQSNIADFKRGTSTPGLPN